MPELFDNRIYISDLELEPTPSRSEAFDYERDIDPEGQEAIDRWLRNEDSKDNAVWFFALAAMRNIQPDRYLRFQIEERSRDILVNARDEALSIGIYLEALEFNHCLRELFPAEIAHFDLGDTAWETVSNLVANSLAIEKTWYHWLNYRAEMLLNYPKRRFDLQSEGREWEIVREQLANISTTTIPDPVFLRQLVYARIVFGDDVTQEFLDQYRDRSVIHEQIDRINHSLIQQARLDYSLSEETPTLAQELQDIMWLTAPRMYISDSGLQVVTGQDPLAHEQSQTLPDPRRYYDR